MLMPAFERYPKEAEIIGRLLAGYGELDFTFARCVARVCDDEQTLLRAIFRMRTESGRIALGDTLITPKLEKHNRLAGDYTHAIGCMRHCLQLRNQYAHCHWMDDDKGGLFFANMEDAAKKATGFDADWLHVDTTLLSKQEEFFFHTMKCFSYIESEYFHLNGKPLRGLLLRRMPQRMPQPKKHNPPEKHRPPWLDEEISPPPKEHPQKAKRSPRKSRR